MTSDASRKAHIVGLGLIGCSIALALKEHGWQVSGSDTDDNTQQECLQAELISSVVASPDTKLFLVATPAGVVVEVVNELCREFDNPDAVFTDVAGVKESIVSAIADNRFLGGHPMAGSELRGLAGARADIFTGCTWVLTPSTSTPNDLYTFLHGTFREIGANVVAVDGAVHDRLMAVASHVPHLIAGSLMNEASSVASQDAVLLQLAAGGFRDMTRIAAGDPTIWPDILLDNAKAILQTLEDIEGRLGRIREAIESADRESLRAGLSAASEARRQLPGRALDSENLSYLRVGLSDQPGSLAKVTTTASDLLVNIYDIEIAHAVDEAQGTLLLAVDASQATLLAEALSVIGFQVGAQ